MSEISSTSELTTKEIVEQAIQDYHATILPYLAKGNNGYSETPIGAIQFFDDDTAPSGWLVADGTVYNIDDYPFLANHYERVHGSKNHYGGDGIITFAVPDWRGEFFRAAGTNAHPNQGSGANVGVHQDGTEHPTVTLYGKQWFGIGADNNGSSFNTQPKNKDASSSRTGINEVSSSYNASAVATEGSYTSRPTNTSLLCCIKAVPAGINYSLEEQEVGTDVDGKPVYQKTISNNNLIKNDWNTIDTIPNIYKLKFIEGSITDSNGAIWNMFGYRNSEVYFETLKDGNDIRVFVSSANIFAGGKAELTIQYTKTTD